MICFPNAKINLGLNIVNKRPDGYHNIETVLDKIQFLYYDNHPGVYSQCSAPG